MITLKAYAKLNLSLTVLGQRTDGYHDLDTIMQSISLFDTVTVGRSQDICVRMEKVGVEEKSNTAFFAAKAFSEYTKSGGADISIQKNIPLMAGLGGASADAAAVLIGMDRLYGTFLEPEALMELAKSVGADVPFALSGGCARAKGIGEKLKSLKPRKPMYYTVVKPYSGVPTAEAFKKFKKSARINIDTVEYAVVKGDTDLFSRYAGNSLGIAALSIAPDILKATEALRLAGAQKALLTGSGSAVFAVFETFDAARSASEKIKKSDFELAEAFCPVSAGVEITGETK